ncbi:MAG: calcium-binding EGF-like domain-containing protein [Bacteroidota bacterium]
MKSIRNIAFTTLFTVSAFTCILYSAACNKNNCGSFNCQNGGTCTSDTCACPTGYTGNNCQNAWSTQYLGTYKCTQVCTPAVTSNSWSSTITQDATNGGYTLDISRFGNINLSVVANVVDNNGHITLTASSTTTNTIMGSGTLVVNGSTTTLTINYSTGTGGSACTITMIKQ